MLYRNAAATPVQMLPGLVRRTLAEGPSMMMCEFTFEAGVQIPTHAHPHEQIGYVVSGRMRLTVADASFEVGPGDSYRAPSNVPHSALSLEPSLIVETFSPPREDYRQTKA